MINLKLIKQVNYNCLQLLNMPSAYAINNNIYYLLNRRRYLCYKCLHLLDMPSAYAINNNTYYLLKGGF